MGFELCEKEQLRFFKIKEFEEFGVEAVFTTRQYLSCNQFTLSYKWAQQDKIRVDKNYKALFKIFNIDYNNIYYAKQVHKDDIIVVDRGFNFFEFTNQEEADGLITTKTNLTLITFHADCIPVYIFDKEKKIVCLIHSGWRGTLKRITKKGIEMLIEKFGSLPQDLIVGIGPGICKKHFEVGYDVYEAFINEFGGEIGFVNDNNNSYYIDLKNVIKYDIIQCGISEDRLIISNECTFENENLFYSYRRDKGDVDKLGSMIAFVRMVGDEKHFNC